MPRAHAAFVLVAIGATGMFVSGELLAASSAATVNVVSSRPDMVSGGDALLEIGAGDVDVSNARVSVNGIAQKVTIKTDSAGRRLAYLTGLSKGTSRVEVTLDDGRIATATLTNHDLSGPIISGPHQMPWFCDTDNFVLPDATRLQTSDNPECMGPTVVQYVYQNVKGAIVPLPNPSSLPADVRKTTTVEGVTANLVIRIETGTINRAIYQISMLHDPSTDAPPTPWSRPRGWHGRLVYVFGGGCNPGFRQGATFGYAELPLHELSSGYAVASSTLNVWGNNGCNSLVSAETLSMTKERFIEAYGIPKYTISKGGSGGAKSQLMIADAYPGLLDGIMPASQAGGPDGVTANPATLDCSLLVHYFNSKTTLQWSYEQKTAVAGWLGWRNCERQAADDPPAEGASYWHGHFSPKYVVASTHRPPNTFGNSQFYGCPAEIDASRIYDRVKNPGGIRCDVYSAQKNIWGLTKGAPRRPLDNVGLEYGLKALKAGVITAEQFIDLNEKIGGYHADGGYIDQRTVADPRALRIAYQTGQVLNGAQGLNSTPIIDVHRYEDHEPDIHDLLGSFITLERLRVANGNTDNMVLYTFHQSGPATQIATQEALSRMTRWLDAIQSDTSADSMAVKVRRNKPSGLADTCWGEDLKRIVEPATYEGESLCKRMFPASANPRIAAEMPLRNDVLKCQLKPVAADAYGGALNDQQLARIRAAHPKGVCDFSKPGVEQQGLIGTWISFKSPAAPVALSP